MSKEFKSNGFSVIELAIVIAVLSIFSGVAIPAFNCVRRRAISTAAQETIRQIKEECETNYIYGKDKFTSSNPDKYQISSNGSNSCSGGTVTLTPEDTNLYPTYLYKFADSQLSYNFKGQTGTSFVACNKLICENLIEKNSEKNENKNIANINQILDENCEDSSSELVIARYTMNLNGTIPPLIGGGRGYHFKNIPGICDPQKGSCASQEPDGYSHHQDYYLIGVFEREIYNNFSEVDQPGKKIFCSQIQLVEYMKDHFTPPKKPENGASEMEKESYANSPKTSEEYVNNFMTIYKYDSNGKNFF